MAGTCTGSGRMWRVGWLWALAAVAVLPQATCSPRSAAVGAPDSLAGYVWHLDSYCIGNYPGKPLYEADLGLLDCVKKCDELHCECFDVNRTATGHNCRLTNASTAVSRSSAGYSAYVSKAAPGPPGPPPASVKIGVDFSSPGRPFDHFWRSCGWCPPDPHPKFAEFFLQEDQRQNHLLIGSTPHLGVKYVRIHYLLDLIEALPAGCHASDNVTVLVSPFFANQCLNWTNLDLAMDLVTDAGLFLGFEVMGNPSGSLFTSFKDDAQIAGWEEMVRLLATRYLVRYGEGQVQQWRFESWNEPEGQCPRQLTVGIDCDLPSFIKYWDATVHGLRAAGDLTFGGTASDGDHSYLFAVLDHCLHGVNHITNETGCSRIDFFNAHLKGNADSKTIVDKELPVATKVAALVQGTPLASGRWGNDEADPLVGWNRIEPWRADARYPGMIAKTIAQHQEVFVDGLGLRYDVLSNDNGFLPYPDNHDHVFTQRTLVARFAMNKTGSVELVRKPSLNVMGLLAKLGDRLYNSTGLSSTMVSPMGALATADASDRVSILVYSSLDSADTESSSNVTLALSGLPAGLGPQPVAAAFRLDNQHGSALPVWVGAGSPVYPLAATFAAMRDAAEVPMFPGFPRAVPVTAGALTLDLPVALPGVVLVQLCGQAEAAAPAAPRIATVLRTKTPDPIEHLITWEDDTRCVKTFVVYAVAAGRGAGAGLPQRLNKVDTIFRSYLDAQPSAAVWGAGSHCYAVSVVNLAGAESLRSAVVCA